MPTLPIPRDVSALPQNDASIHPARPFLKFQTCQAAKRDVPTPISEEEYNKGTETTRTHDMCLECLGDIDTSTCRSVNADWGIGWHCEKCGYYKKSNELIMTFLMGAHMNAIDPTEIDSYKVRQFPWVELPRLDTSKFKIEQIYQQTACIAQRGGTNLREALGDADFFGRPGIFDILARGWADQREWLFCATRFQGIILLNHELKRPNYTKYTAEDKERKRTALPAPTDTEPRKVTNFHLIRSELCATSGKSTSFSVLSEFNLTADGEPIRHNKSCANEYHRYQFELGRALTMQLTGINRISVEGEDKEWTLEEARAVINPEDEQRSWDFLAEALSLIRDCLQTDGEYSTIAIAKLRGGNMRAEMTIEHQGPIDLNLLRADFRESFRI